MKKLLTVICALAMQCTMHAWSASCPRICCFDASLGIEALYWKPYTDDYIFGQYATANDLLLLDLGPEYDWGFRLFASVQDPCHQNFIDFEWARVCNDADELAEPRPGATLSQFFFSGVTAAEVDTLEATQDSCYQKASAKLGHRFCGNPCHLLYGYLGGRWVYINLKRTSLGTNVNGEGNLGISQQRSSFNGGGVEVGVGGQTNLWCGFGASMRFGAIGALGHTGFSVENNFDVVTTKFLDKRHSRCIAGIELRADINYTYYCQCFWVRGEVGYEINYYSNPLLFSIPQPNVSTTLRSDFGVGGLIAGITIGY